MKKVITTATITLGLIACINETKKEVSTEKETAMTTTQTATAIETSQIDAVIKTLFNGVDQRDWEVEKLNSKIFKTDYGRFRVYRLHGFGRGFRIQDPR